MDNQDLTPAMQELMAQMAAMRAELNDLKERTNVIILPEQQVKPVVSTTRRKALRRLAGGILAGLAVGGVVAALPEQAEARFVAANGAGAIVVTPGATVSGSLNSNAFGLIGTPDSNLALSSLSFVSKAGIVGITSSTAPFTYGVFGSGGSTGVSGSGGTGGTGVSGTGKFGVMGNGTLNGVRGDSTNDYNSIGVYGNSTQGNGVYGNSFSGSGVYGNSTDDVGVRGISTNSLGVYGTGKYGVTGDSGQIGVLGISGLGSVLGNLPSNSGVGVFANTGYGSDLSAFGDNTNYGLYVIAGTYLGRTAVAAVFNGPVYIYGNLSKSGGSFKIDHPQDPGNKYLYHSFVESPDMLNIYNGNVTLNEQGGATVEMPGWFEALNSDYRYQLTCLGQYAPVFVAEEIAERKFKIAGGLSGQKVSWQVTGIRQDAWAKANRIPVEEDKTGAAKGKYLHPEVFGKPEELKIR
jgi:hypothetical protein